MWISVWTVLKNVQIKTDFRGINKGPQIERCQYKKFRILIVSSTFAFKLFQFVVLKIIVSAFHQDGFFKGNKSF